MKILKYFLLFFLVFCLFLFFYIASIQAQDRGVDGDLIDKVVKKHNGDENYNEPGIWSRDDWVFIWHELEKRYGDDGAMEIWCKYHPGSPCCQKKKGANKCICGCSVKYCTYDKDGKNGKCNGTAVAPEDTLFSGGGYIVDCNEACRKYADFGSGNIIAWCGFSSQQDQWGDFGEAYCKAMGGCANWQYSYTQKNNLKFCFTDADCEECTLPKTIPYYKCNYSVPPYVFKQDTEVSPGKIVSAGTYYTCEKVPGCGLSECSIKNDKFSIGSLWDDKLSKWFGPYTMQCKSTSTTSTSTSTSTTTTTTTKPYHYECNYSNAPIYTESKNNGITHNYYTCDLVKTPGSDTCNKSNDIRIFLGWLQTRIPGIKLPQWGYYNASCLKIVFPPTSTSTSTSSTSTTRGSTSSSTTSITSEPGTEPGTEVCRVNDFDITPHLASLLALSDKRSYFIADWWTSNCDSCELWYLPVDADGNPLRDKYGIKQTEYIKSASNLPTSSPDPAYDSDYKYDKDPSNLYVIKNYPQKWGHYLYKLICEGPNNQDESFPVHIFVAPWMIWYEVPPVMPTSKFHTIITSPGWGQSIEEYKGY